MNRMGKNFAFLWLSILLLQSFTVTSYAAKPSEGSIVPLRTVYFRNLQAISQFSCFSLPFACFAHLLFLRCLLFWKVTSKAVSAESKRQVLERNMQYSRICHDLKTPMTSVQGFAAALRDGKIKPEEQKEFFQIIYDKSCYMNELVESIFAYAKIETDEFRLHYVNRDLGALVRSVVALSYEEFEKQEIDLQLDIPDQPVLCSLDENEICSS